MPTSSSEEADPVEVEMQPKLSPREGPEQGAAAADGAVKQQQQQGRDSPVYGQNQTDAERDRIAYQETLRQFEEEAAAQPNNNAAGANGDGDGDYGAGFGGPGGIVAEGQVIGVDDHHGRWTTTPVGLFVGATEDIFIVVPYSRLNGVCVVAAVVIACVCFGSSGARADILTLMVGSVAAVMALVMLWMTRTVRLVFNRADSHFRVEERRLLRFCCAPMIPLEASFDQLHGAGFDASIGTPGDLYLDVDTTRVAIGHRIYETRLQMMAEVMPWRSYIAGLRGLSPQDFEIAMMLRQVAGAMMMRSVRDQPATRHV